MRCWRAGDETAVLRARDAGRAALGWPLPALAPGPRPVPGRAGGRHRLRRDRMAAGGAGGDRPRQCPGGPRRRDRGGRPADGPLPAAGPRRAPRPRPAAGAGDRRRSRRSAAAARSGGWRRRATSASPPPPTAARGDRAVYDIDQAVLVLTGRDLSLTTRAAGDHRPRQPGILVAAQAWRSRAAMPWWWTMPRAGGSPPIRWSPTSSTGRAPAPPRRPAPPWPPPGPRRRAPPGAGKLDRVEAFGNVEIRTPTEVVRGEPRRLQRRDRHGPAARRRADHPRRQPGQRAGGHREHADRRRAAGLRPGRPGAGADPAEPEPGQRAGRGQPRGGAARPNPRRRSAASR